MYCNVYFHKLSVNIFFYTINYLVNLVLIVNYKYLTCKIRQLGRLYLSFLYFCEDTSRPERVPNIGQMDNFSVTTKVERAMLQIKKDESPCPDNIYGAFLKLIDAEDVSWLTKLFNRI